VEERRICLVLYKAAGKSEGKEHRFAPGRIIGMSNALYVIGADLTENLLEIRHLSNLAVHRIQDVVLTERKYRMELPEASPDEFGLPWHEPRNFRIFFKPGRAADYVRERIWSENQRFEEHDDGSLLLELTTRSEPELQAWVRSFGEEAKLMPLLR
jgi:hypothetical protein